MKKLMILAAVVVAAVASHAASVKWTTDVIYAPDTTGAFTSTKAYNNALVTSFSVDITFYDANGNELTDITSGLSSSSITKASKATGTTAGYDFVQNNTYQYSAIFKMTYDGVDYTMNIDKTEFTQTAGTGNFALTVPTSSAWTPETTDVPEPTSGLLLLVGVAGLALRRRRA